jgi:aldehyde:ferredoxin oxidoreductase
MARPSFGWTGRILRVDLSTRKISVESSTSYTRRFIGGIGVGMKVMWDEVSPDVHAFDPENRLIFMTGPLTGTLAPSSGRIEVCAKAPGIDPSVPTRSGIGGYWGPELKFSGYDGLIVQGRTEVPSVLEIFDDKIQITTASDLWGLDSYEAQKAISRNYGKDAKSVCIGPAGENRVHFAAIISDSGYAAAKTGMGAVMGSKNLKAIVAKGTKGLRVARADEFIDVCKHATKLLRNHPMRKWTSQGPVIIEMEFAERHRNKFASCFNCPVACRSFIEMPGMDGGEVMCLSQYYLCLGAEDDGASWNGKVLADKLGLCSYTLFDMLGWLNEEYKAGHITEEETEIPWSRFGTSEFISLVLHGIARREGFGDVIADGPDGILRYLGEKGKHSYEAHFPARGQAEHYSVRAYPVALMQWAMGARDPISDAHDWMALVYWAGMHWPRTQKGALTPEQLKAIGRDVYGSEESVDPHSYEDKARTTAIVQNMSYLKNSLVLCDWSTFPILMSVNTPPNFRGDPDVERKLFCAATGTDLDKAEWLKIGERIVNLERAILVREGRRKKDDTVGEYHFRVPETEVPPWELPLDPPPVADKEKFERMRDEFYEIRGWDPDTGIPTEVKLRELELDDVADQLIKEGLIKDVSEGLGST